MSNDPAMDILERVLDQPTTISLETIERMPLDSKLFEQTAGAPIEILRYANGRMWRVRWTGIPDASGRPGIPGNTFRARTAQRALYYLDRFARQADKWRHWDTGSTPSEQ